MSGAKRRGSAGMHRRPNAAWVSSPVVVWPGCITGRMPVHFVHGLLRRIEQATAAVPGDDFVGGEFGEQKRRERVGEHRQNAGGKSPQARGSGIEEEPIHREGPAVEPAFQIPEADALFTCGSRDAEPGQLVVRQFLGGGEANRPVARKSGRRDRGAGAEASTAVVDDEGDVIGGPGICRRRGQLRSSRGVSRPLPLKRLSG